MTQAHLPEPTIFHSTINPDPNPSVGPKVGERPPSQRHDLFKVASKGQDLFDANRLEGQCIKR